MLQEVGDCALSESGNQCWAGMEPGVQKQVGYQLVLFFGEEPAKCIAVIPGIFPVPLVITSRRTTHLKSML
jgi:hypothetical protein